MKRPEAAARMVLCCSMIVTGMTSMAGAGTTGHGSGAAARGPAHFVLRGATVAGGARGGPAGPSGPADVEVRDGRIAAVGKAGALSPGGAPVVDVHGRFLAPAFIDSHVHLAYFPVGRALAAHGVAGAVDLAAPLGWLATSHAPLRVLASGPMITAVRGYPTDSWGSDGYGLECADAAAARAAVDRLHAAGAALVKIPITDPPVLSDAALRAAVERAHALGLRVAVHALADDEARRAADAGADILAHTPLERLAEATVAAWRGRTVISTLGAFGGAARAVENLTRLRAAGLTVLYGTDLGNTRLVGIDPRELALLGDAGLDGAAILAAGTATPAAFWGTPLDTLGTIAPGKAASLLVLAADPRAEPGTLAAPLDVYLDGARLSPPPPTAAGGEP
jgi:imidazolonepropionase-like amidohydrolase